MSQVSTTPAYVAAAASDLAGIGSTISFANSAALGPTSSVLPPGADEVSMSIAALFGTHSQIYQQLSAQAALFHQQFVQLMSGSATQYAATEAANASPLQAVGQGALGTAGSAGSVVAGMPAAATAGLTGGSAPVASAGHLVTAASPPSGVSPAYAPAAYAPASTPLAAMQAAAPAGRGPLAPAATPTGAVQAEMSTHAPAPVTLAHSIEPAAAPETPEMSPAAAMPAPLAPSTPATRAAASFRGQPARYAPT
jgi:PE family